LGRNRELSKINKPRLLDFLDKARPVLFLPTTNRKLLNEPPPEPGRLTLIRPEFCGAH